MRIRIGRLRWGFWLFCVRCLVWAFSFSRVVGRMDWGEGGWMGGSMGMMVERGEDDKLTIFFFFKE